MANRRFKIFWPKAGWLPEHYLMAMPNELIKLGFDITVHDDWLDSDSKLKNYEGYDLIVCHGPSVIRPFVSGDNIDIKTPPQIHHVWDYPAFRQWDGWGFNFIVNEFESIKRRAFKVITMSQTTQKYLKDLYDIDSDIQLTYFDNQMVDSVPDQPKKNQIIVACHHRPEKNIQLVFQALSMFEDKPEIVLTGSSGGSEEILLKMEKAFKLKVRRLYNVPHEEVIKEIKSSKVLVHPSAFEGFGLSPKEAIWAGVYTIVSDIPVFHEYHGLPMAYVSTVDPNALCHHLQLILRDEPVYHISEARKLIEPLTIENQALKFADYLNTLELP